MEDQGRLFDERDENWREAWNGMPEFETTDTAPSQSIIVNFQCDDDRKRFSELIGQKTTYKTKSLWFPPKDELAPKNFVYTTKPQK